MTKTKSKIVKRKQFTAAERDEQLWLYAGEAFRSMHICLHGGSPDDGLLIGRSLFPLLAKRIHRVMVDRPHSGLSLNQILEDMVAHGIVDECTHISLRRAAAALGDYGSGRDLNDVVAACDVLRRIAKSEAFRNAVEARRLAKARKLTDRRRPAVLRWAAAAAGLFGIGS